MHYCLGLGRPSKKDGTGVPENIIELDGPLRLADPAHI